MLVFDFDGVVVDSLALCAEGCRRAARAQGAGVSLADNPFSELDPLTFQALARDLSLEPERFLADLTAHIEASPPPLVFAGMVDAVRDLAPHAELAVLSASPETAIRRALHAAGLESAFTNILGDRPGQDKPEKLTGLIAAAQPGSHAMIGDAASDMAAAQAAGVAGFGVAWGWQDPQRLLEAGARAVAQTPDALCALLLEHCAAKEAET